MTWWAWALVLLFLFWPLLLLLLIPKMGVSWGFAYAAVQWFMWWCTIIGWFLLIYPCIKQRWVADIASADIVKTQRVTIDRWAGRWAFLNPFYGNKADGVSGKYAILNDGSSYLPNASPAWRAYAWSALRNSCDNLKYEFAADNAPAPVTFWFFGSRRAGWILMPQIKGSPRVPVLG